MRFWFIVFVLGCLGVKADTSEKIKELEKEIEKLKDEVHSKEQIDNPLHFGGYGEVHYVHQSGDDQVSKDEIDFHRFVLFMAYNFNEKMSLISELEVEHAISGDGQEGEVELEQAFIQYRASNGLAFNMGLLLAPVGILNETHEPPTFYGVERNPVEKNILPSTWVVSGVGVKKEFKSGLSFDTVIHEGLDISENFSIRSGRQKASEANMDSPAVTIRLAQNASNGLKFQTSVQYQDDFSQGQPYGGDLLLLTGNIQYQLGKFTTKGLYAYWSLGGEEAKLSQKDRQDGGYLEIDYRLNPNWGFYTRYNKWSTTKDLDEEQAELGLNYWFNWQVVLKMDVFKYEFEDQKTDGLHLGLGYQF